MRSVIAGSIWSASHANIAMALRGGETFPARERIKFERQHQIHGCKQSDASNKIVRSIKAHPFREIGCKDSVLHVPVVAIPNWHTACYLLIEISEAHKKDANTWPVGLGSGLLR